MNPPYAVAGADIEVGMTVVLAPGDDAFVVQRIEPFKKPGKYQYVYNEDGFPCIVRTDAWYGQVEQS